jgi:hypothetical protein
MYICYIDITLFFVSSGKTTIPLARYRYDGDALGGDKASVDRSDDGNDSAAPTIVAMGTMWICSATLPSMRKVIMVSTLMIKPPPSGRCLVCVTVLSILLLK